MADVRLPVLPVLRSPVSSVLTSRPRGGLRSLAAAAESAARTSGVSLWYAPPESYSPRAVNGPFVNSDQTGGVSVLSGVVGFVKDRKVL